MKYLTSRDVAQVFGGNIRRIRRSKNLTQQQLALRLGCGQSSVSHAESGVNGPTLTTALAYAKALGVPLIELIKGLDA